MHASSLVTTMRPLRSDAFVFFGATGDMAYKQIFPALYALARDGLLRMPVIGVARSPWDTRRLQEQARRSISAHGGVDERVFARLARRLQYIRGDYSGAETFRRLSDVLGTARHP